jgi:RimJ/RimL family protein N-acetyltransferase
MKPYRAYFRMKDGRTVAIRDLSQKDSPKELADYINELVDENTFIIKDTKVSVKEEVKWLREKLKSAKSGRSISLVAYDKKIVGIVNADRQTMKQKGNVVLGIALRKEYRGHGLGEFIFRLLIERVKKEMKPKNIFLYVFGRNTRAKSLYIKLGFRKIGVLPNWVLHKGRYMDEEMMILKQPAKKANQFR